MNKRLILFLWCLYFIPCTYGQKYKQGQIDSIINVLPKYKEDTNRVNLLLSIAGAYNDLKPMTGLKYGDTALALATRLHFYRGMALANSLRGTSYYWINKYTEASALWFEALKIYTRINDRNGIAQSQGKLGNVFNRLFNTLVAKQYYDSAIAYFTSINDTASRILWQSNLANAYMRESRFEEVRTIYRFAADYYHRKGNKVPEIDNLSRMANSYNWEKNFKMALNIMEKIIPLLNDSIYAGIKAKVFAQYGVAAIDYSHVLKGDSLNKNTDPLLIAKMSKLGFAYSDSALTLFLAEGDLQNATTAFVNKAEAAKDAGNLLLAYSTLERSMIITDSLRRNTSKEDIVRLEERYKASYREDSLSNIQALAQQHFLQQQQLSAIRLIQQHQQLKLRQAALDLSNKQLTLTQQEKQIQSLAFEKQQGDYMRAQKEKDNQLKLAAQQNKIQMLEIENSRRASYLSIAGLLLLAGIAAYVIRQNQLRKKANRQLFLSNRQLDEANRVKARFFGILSHDLRAPIANLTNYLHLQREAPELMDEQSRAVHQLVIENAANNLLSIMEDLLLWSKGQMSSFRPEIKSVQILQLFEEIKKLVPHDTDVNVVFADPGLLQIDTDENFLKTIMRNLTANALKALNGQSGGKVEWKAWETKGKKYLSVTDNGPGLNREQIETLFAESAVTSSKTGLGLHIVRDFVQMLGQQIEVKSEPGKGTSFILSMAA